MKLKKIISAISALALTVSAFSMFTVADASLGGKPTVTAEFVEYTTNSSQSWAKAWIKVTIDMSKAEALAPLKSETVWDDTEEDYVAVETGNGLKTAGFAIKPTNEVFATQTTNNTAADRWTLKVNDATGLYTAAFGPKQDAAEYYTDSTAEFIVNYKVTSANFDASTDINLQEVTLGGYNQTTGAWSYLASNIDIINVSIPSYNEWSTPSATATPTPTPVVTEAPTATPTVEPTPEVTPEPVAGVEKFSDTDAAAWAWETAAVAGSKVKVTVTDGTTEGAKTFDLNAAVEGSVKVGVIVQYNPTAFPNFAIVDVEIQ